MNSYQNYLPTWPTGEDLSGLKPQKAISDAIVKHIKEYDSEHTDGGIMPKVIGLKGKWGSGKSNVIKQLGVDESLANNYLLIEFDAWAYQEDEYRISLMEHITNKLSQQQPEKAGDYSELLRRALSQEEYEVTKFEPHVSGLLFWLIGTIAFTSLFGFIFSLFPDNNHYRWCRLFFIVVPWVVLSIYTWFQRKNLDDLLVVFENAIRNGATTKSVYTREPSVSDLRTWLRKASDLCGKKLIVVIDNMDRLPNEKLKKLWSMIHIFANNEEMANVWIVIPYDEQKLKKVIGDDYKQYLLKSIPVTFCVGEPIVSDARDVFDGLFEKAFGKQECSQNNIRAMFMNTLGQYSIREIIHFINAMVTVKKQFPSLTFVSVALYVLMEDEIKENANKVLLEDRFASKYATMVDISEDNRSEVAAMVYHVSKNDGMQKAFQNALEQAVTFGNDLPIDKVKDRADFYKVLTDYYSEPGLQTFEGYIEVLGIVEGHSKLDFKSEIETCWNSIIQFYIGNNYDQVPWLGYERLKELYSHCNKTQAIPVLSRYLNYMLLRKETKGSDVFKFFEEVDGIIKETDIKISDFIGKFNAKPMMFREYLDAAKEKYKKYPVECESEAWISFCVNLISGDAGQLLCISYMRNDERFDFTKLKEKAEEMIGDNGGDERNSLKAYKIYRSLSMHPVKVKPARRIAVSDIINTYDQVDNDPVFIALRMYHNNQAIINDNLVPEIAKEIMCLMYPLEIFCKGGRDDIDSFKKVTRYIVKNKMLCDYRLQNNIMELSKPLIDKGIVTKKELEEYIEASFEDAEKRNLPVGTVFTY